MENSMQVPKKIKKQDCYMIQQFYFWVFFWEKQDMFSYAHFSLIYYSQDMEATIYIYRLF